MRKTGGPINLGSIVDIAQGINEAKGSEPSGVNCNYSLMVVSFRSNMTLLYLQIALQSNFPVNKEIFQFRLAL